MSQKRMSWEAILQTENYRQQKYLAHVSEEETKTYF